MFIISNKTIGSYFKQVIERRNIAYRTALDLIQGEEYLDAADTDIIRRLR